MKFLGLLFLSVTLVSCAQVSDKANREISSVVNEPRPEVFDRIAKAATKAGFEGNDVTACLNKRGKNTLVFGGVSSWNSAMRLLVADADGYLFPTKQVTTDSTTRIIEFIYKGDKLKLVLGNPASNTTTFDAQLMKDANVLNDSLICFFRGSGLE